MENDYLLERIELAEDLIRHGVGPGTNLHEALVVCERLIVEATMRRSTTITEAAQRLGVTREGFYGVRKRLGIEVPPASKPVPEDWRERLAL